MPTKAVAIASAPASFWTARASLAAASPAASAWALDLTAPFSPLADDPRQLARRRADCRPKGGRHLPGDLARQRLGLRVVALAKILRRIHGLTGVALERGHRGLDARFDRLHHEVDRLEGNALVGQERVASARLQALPLAGVEREAVLRFVGDAVAGRPRMAAAGAAADGAAGAGADARTDVLRLVLLDVDLPILLRLDVEQFRSLRVLHPDLVEVVRPASLTAAALDPAVRDVGRHRVGRHVRGVVDAAGDDRLVRIPFQEVDDHLLPDARVEHDPPLLARPSLRHTHPAGAVLVVLAVAVPVKLDLHAAVLVGVDLVTRPDRRPPPFAAPARTAWALRASAGIAARSTSRQSCMRKSVALRQWAWLRNR